MSHLIVNDRLRTEVFTFRYRERRIANEQIGRFTVYYDRDFNPISHQKLYVCIKAYDNDFVGAVTPMVVRMSTIIKGDKTLHLIHRTADWVESCPIECINSDNFVITLENAITGALIDSTVLNDITLVFEFVINTPMSREPCN